MSTQMTTPHNVILGNVLLCSVIGYITKIVSELVLVVQCNPWSAGER